MNTKVINVQEDQIAEKDDLLRQAGEILKNGGDISKFVPEVVDKYFKKCCACGKQALTMCMGFGCNAVGVPGCRIIDSKRERLIAIITNVFVPCNGRFPILIAIITMFFASTFIEPFNSIFST